MDNLKFLGMFLRYSRNELGVFKNTNKMNKYKKEGKKYFKFVFIASENVFGNEKDRNILSGYSYANQKNNYKDLLRYLLCNLFPKQRAKYKNKIDYINLYKHYEDEYKSEPDCLICKLVWSDDNECFQIFETNKFLDNQTLYKKYIDQIYEILANNFERENIYSFVTRRKKILIDFGKMLSEEESKNEISKRIASINLDELIRLKKELYNEIKKEALSYSYFQNCQDVKTELGYLLIADIIKLFIIHPLHK